MKLGLLLLLTFVATSSNSVPSNKVTANNLLLFPITSIVNSTITGLVGLLVSIGCFSRRTVIPTHQRVVSLKLVTLGLLLSTRVVSGLIPTIPWNFTESYYLTPEYKTLIAEVAPELGLEAEELQLLLREADKPITDVLALLRSRPLLKSPTDWSEAMTGVQIKTAQTALSVYSKQFEWYKTALLTIEFGRKYMMANSIEEKIAVMTDDKPGKTVIKQLRILEEHRATVDGWYRKALSAGILEWVERDDEVNNLLTRELNTSYSIMSSKLLNTTRLALISGGMIDAYKAMNETVDGIGTEDYAGLAKWTWAENRYLELKRQDDKEQAILHARLVFLQQRMGYWPMLIAETNLNKTLSAIHSRNSHRDPTEL